MINVNENKISLDLKNNYTEFCQTELHKINKLKYQKFDNEISLLTNCEDGKFHKWEFKKDNLVCKLCNKKYNELIKKSNLINNIKNNKKIIDKILLSYLQKLTKTNCISGELHEFGSDNVCKKCKINPNDFKYNSKMLLELKKSIKKRHEKILNQIDKFRKVNNTFLKKEKILK